MGLLDEYKKTVEPEVIKLAQIRRENYKDVSGITHIFVKDGEKVMEVPRYECTNCGAPNSHFRFLCAECDARSE